MVKKKKSVLSEYMATLEWLSIEIVTFYPHNLSLAANPEQLSERQVT